MSAINIGYGVLTIAAENSRAHASATCALGGNRRKEVPCLRIPAQARSYSTSMSVSVHSCDNITVISKAGVSAWASRTCGKSQMPVSLRLTYVINKACVSVRASRTREKSQIAIASVTQVGTCY